LTFFLKEKNSSEDDATDGKRRKKKFKTSSSYYFELIFPKVAMSFNMLMLFIVCLFCGMIQDIYRQQELK
jgi:hypothetical protein